MQIYSLKQIFSLARENSPIYRELYRDISMDFEDLTSLPVLSHKQLMKIVHDKEAIRFFNTGNCDGIIYQSSATTGQPKATIFGRDEWQTTVKMLAVNHWRDGSLKDGDIVANLCVGGSASFMFVHGTIENFPGRCSELPLGSDHEFDYLITTWRKFSANVLAGINSTFLGLAWHLTSQGKSAPEITRILCGGELFYGSQLNMVQRAFPNATLIPFMFATTETGLIGLSEAGFSQNEFRVCSDACILEIIDVETRRPIQQPFKMGLAVVTSLLRTSAPAIRLETGDYAQWQEEAGEKNRKFSIHGRSYLLEYPFFNISITETDVNRIIDCMEPDVSLLKIKIELHDNKVKVIFSSDEGNLCEEHFKKIICNAIRTVKPEVIIHEQALEVEQVTFSYFLENIRRKGRVISDVRTHQ